MGLTKDELNNITLIDGFAALTRSKEHAEEDHSQGCSDRCQIVDHTAPQPTPVVDENARAIWPVLIAETEDAAEIETSAEDARILRLVAADMKKRHENGLAKYGVPLVADNGRDQIADAYQEALDGVAYTKAAIESDSFVALQPVDRQVVMSAHERFKEACEMLRSVLARRDGR